MNSQKGREKKGKAGGREPAKFVGFHPFVIGASKKTTFYLSFDRRYRKKTGKMKGSGPLVATVLVASTVALTSSSSAGVQHVSFSPTSSNQESQNSASRNRTALEREKFAPRFDGLRFIETLVTAHR
ncbi:hypothetical protein ERO13_D12G243000v2 [Gossypium hirsutum]|uniref:Uncharacterized protein n=1 Tax=Gossypium hirsutum TaxID=3635 RepID=A0A1U8LPC4_GOSHI|nr:uncharacterized protein LOC107929475 [Gossypium hirsutum]KAG4117613.1 hypothetical protein ERO13_D12G243000v2 [Gossypium hirsutum]